MARRKVTYPPPKTATRQVRPGAGDDATRVRPTVVSIDLNARAGRAGLAVGDRVRITGTGLYANEIATIERLVSGPVPAAVVRTEAGRSRQVRTVDLEPVRSEG